MQSIGLKYCLEQAFLTYHSFLAGISKSAGVLDAFKGSGAGCGLAYRWLLR